MCLTIKSGPHTAKKDFFTIKVAENVTSKSSQSFYKYRKQNYGKLIKSRVFAGTGRIEIGLHSIYKYNSDEYTLLDSHNLVDRIGLLLCKIPKGTEYYLGVNGDIATNQLIIVEPLICAHNLLEKSVNELYGQLLSTSYEKALKICKSYKLNMKPS